MEQPLSLNFRFITAIAVAKYITTGCFGERIIMQKGSDILFTTGQKLCN